MTSRLGGQIFVTIPYPQWLVVNQSLAMWLPAKEWDEVKAHPDKVVFRIKTSPEGTAGQELTLPPGLTVGRRGRLNIGSGMIPSMTTFEIPLEVMPKPLANRLRQFGRRLAREFMDAMR